MSNVQLALPGVLSDTHVEWVWNSEDTIFVNQLLRTPR